MPHFADIILPVPLQKLFTYKVPNSMMDNISVGSRVVVQFGKKKSYSGIVHSIHSNAPEGYETKDITTLVDAEPIVTTEQLKFWQWIADYYVCTLGEVYKAALPSGLKLESESKVIYNANFEAEAPLNAKQEQILNFVTDKKICAISEVVQYCTEFNALPVVKQLLDMQALFISEELRESYKPRTEKFFSLAPEARSNEALQQWFDKLERAPKQLDALTIFIQNVGGLGKAMLGEAIMRTAFIGENAASATAVQELVNKGVLLCALQNISRLGAANIDTHEANPLSDVQQTAYNEIVESFDTHNTTLLHGVTSSGKTEIYIHIINKFIAEGKRILYLLPEIALTTQITSRLRRQFGDKLGIYHSKFSDAERVEVWNNLLHNDGYRVILGVRSSVLLPLTNIGLIIVDEEHETSYKQFDPAPRYNARDAAVMLGIQQGAKVLLGSATPSIESYYNAKAGRYGLVELHTRYAGIEMPDIIPINTKEARKRKQMTSMFSQQMKESIEQALENKEQIILFQNRRGFSPYVECKQCAWVPKCQNCDVSLTYHKNVNQLVCHYCGFTMPLPPVCPACGTPGLDTKGYGTEKIEEEVKEIFPSANITRMDLDTARSRKAYEKIISEFEQHQSDILIGTQMISKGLDFDNVSTVGILNADNMLNHPDFRAFERCFQMVAQVSGRAGRKGKRGTVLLQTSDTEHPVIKDVVNNNFIHHYNQQIAEREAYRYPPFYRLINITIKHKEWNCAARGAHSLAQVLTGIFGWRVLGPQEPPINRIATLFLQRITLKVERNSNPSQVKALMMTAVNQILAEDQFKRLVIQIDVDPY